MTSTRPRNAWILVSAVFVVFFVLSRNLPDIQNWIWWAHAVATAALIIATALMRRVWARSAWGCVAGGITMLLISSMAWTVAGRPIPGSGSVAALQDITYALAMAGFAAAGLILMHRRRRGTHDITGFLDAAIVFVASSMIVAQFLIYPLWNNLLLDPRQRALLVLFATVCLVVLSITVRLWFATDRNVNRAVRILIVGFIFLLAGEALMLLGWLVPDPNATQVHELIVDLLQMGLFIAAGAAVLDPTASRPPAGDTGAALADRSRVLVVLGVCILIPPILLLIAGSEPDSFTDSRSFVIAMIVLTGLLGLRVNLLLQGFREAVRREHTLREINAGLMRTTDIADVNNRLADWASRLVEQDDVTCVLGTVDELAAIGLGPFGTRYRDDNGHLRYRTVVAVPGSRPTRRLVVETPEAINTNAQASLSVLGQSVGMALERIALSRRVVERATSERLQLLLHNASDVIALVDDEGTIRYVTEAIRDLTGHDPIDCVGTSWVGLFQDPALARGLLQRANDDGEARGDLVIDPNAIRASALPTPVNGEQNPDRRVEVDVAWLSSESEYVVTHHDVTERYLLEQQLAFQAFHDELTGLNNRAVFRSELARAAARSRRSKVPFAVMMIDLDDFKNVNDSMGHPAGDDLLRAVAARLVECMREGDTPVRLGGDEFAVILESARSAQDAKLVGERLLAKLSEPVPLRGTEVVVGASVGIAVSDGHADPADVERDADIALYEAKFAGKGRIAVFRSDMHDVAVQKLSLTNQLRGALDRDELTLIYQPIVELGSGAVAGAEALVRWHHPSHGVLVPDMFIALAEETGQIIDLGRFVIRQALRDLAGWSSAQPAHANSRVTINISGRQLQEDDVAGVIAATMAETGVTPDQIVAEVTESVLLPDDGVAAVQLRRLADLGISIYIDDFGTGWASLHYLRSLPVTGLKLAQEFVSGLPSEFDGGLARAILELANSQALEEVIAEGVESAEHADALARLGYRLAQGYLLSKPLSADEFSAFLAKRAPTVWNLPAGSPRLVPAPYAESGLGHDHVSFPLPPLG